MNILQSTISTWRDRLAPVSRTSTFRTSGQITPEEFILAGDYLVYKFPSWSWADASSPPKRVSYLPAGKQFLVTRGVPCHRRLNDNFAGDANFDDEIVRDYLSGGAGDTEGGDDDGWLRTGGGGERHESTIRDVRTVDESGKEEAAEEEEEIPDMEDDDDEEAIIREPVGKSSTTQYVVSLSSFLLKRAVSNRIYIGRLGHTTSTSRTPTSTGLLVSISQDTFPLLSRFPHNS